MKEHKGKQRQLQVMDVAPGKFLAPHSVTVSTPLADISQINLDQGEMILKPAVTFNLDNTLSSAGGSQIG